MKDGFVRVGAVAPEIRVGLITENCNECISEAVRAENLGIKVLAFPELALSGATAGDLFFQRTMLLACERELEKFMEKTSTLDVVSVIGLPALVGNKIYNAAAVVSRGVLLGMVAKSVLTSDERRYFAEAPSENIEISFAGYDTLLGASMLFASESVPALTVAVSIGSEVSSPIAPYRYHAISGATLLVNPTSAPETVCSADADKLRIAADSRSLISSILTASAGEGESGTDGIFSGRCSVYECGHALAESSAFAEDSLVYSECDFDAILAKRLKQPEFECDCSSEYDYISFELDVCEYDLTRKIEKSPFIPEDVAELEHRLERITEIQSRALADRIARSYSKGAVVGISGGLDSTLALLVSARAVDFSA